MAEDGWDVEPEVEAERERPAAGTTFRVEETFDVGVALRLREDIARLPASEPVLLDFSRTRDCHDFALAALVHALATMGREGVTTRGLRDHQRRLLKYLGLSALS